jgi:hypothetical protein
MTNSKGNPVYKVNLSHFPEGSFAVYSDGDGHYSVIGQDGKIAVESLACDYCAMKAMELNRKSLIS